MTDRAIRSVVIVGGGIVGLSAALAFRRSLPNAAVTVVNIPIDPAALADRLPSSWPSIASFHVLIGLEEVDLLRRGIAVHHVGTVFDDWPAGRNWVHGFGPHGKPVGAVHFDQVWLQAQQAGDARPFESYSAVDVLTRAGKFAHPSRDTNSLLGRFQYGLRLDPELYREHLREQAQSRGIGFIEASLANIEKRDDSRLAALILSSGQRVAADLFIDCSGPAGLLVREVDESFEDWPSHVADHLELEFAPPGTLSPSARVRASDSGWVAEWPLGRRTMRCVAGKHSEGIALRPGRRTRPWTGNVVALGDAATAISPLYDFNLALVHRAIFLALELLPGPDFNPLELAELNRRWLLITDQVRDLIALMHGDRANFPESLKQRLDQYENRGRLPYQEDAILTRDDWASALIGMGNVPQNIDPMASGVPLDRATEAMNRIADELADFAERAPAYPDYLSRITRRP
jgi:tryptophan halogenase